MQPYEIKPDTKLCTILGYNAQTGYMRKYFNKLMKHYGINATAIALNITDEHFAFTMSNVRHSKVDKMMIEREFQQKAAGYCDNLDEDSQKKGKVDFIEIENGEVKGFCLDERVAELFKDPAVIDDRIRFLAKNVLIANRWYDCPVELNDLPLLIGE